MTDINELVQRNDLLIANGYETANLLRHLSENEIDSDYFAVVSECESYGKETDAELSITEFARRAAGYVSELVEALEKAQQMERRWHRVASRIHEQACDSDEKIDELESIIAAGNMEIAALRQRVAELESRAVSAAAADVLAERQRQVTAEGWTPVHDDEHSDGELALAASCYAYIAAYPDCCGGYKYEQWPKHKFWPWEESWWKPKTPRRDLIKAGALILAEIERLDRAAMLQAGNSPIIGIDPASGPEKTVEVRYVAPPGYVMVPREPTAWMLVAGTLVSEWSEDPGGMYRAMIAAAPREVTSARVHPARDE